MGTLSAIRMETPSAQRQMIQSVLIDTREPRWVQQLRFDGATVATTQLSCGDLWVVPADGRLLVIERKTTDDLLNSIGDGRIFDQASRMADTSPWSYVVVQGHIAPAANGKTASGPQTRNWQWSSVQGALQTVQELGVAVVYIPDGEREFHTFVERLAARDRGHVRAAGPRRAELYAPGMLPLLALPGIGDDRAKLLLEQLSSAAWAIEYLTDPHWDGEQHVPGIGKQIKNGVRAALGLPPEFKLAIRPIEE